MRVCGAVMRMWCSDEGMWCSDEGVWCCDELV